MTITDYALEWSSGDVACWLSSIEMDEYVSLFQDARVNGCMLGQNLSDGDLQEMGVANRFHRKRILAEVDRLFRPPTKTSQRSLYMILFSLLITSVHMILCSIGHYFYASQSMLDSLFSIS